MFIKEYKKTIALFILISFLAIVFFGFSVIMMHGSNQSMSESCSFSSMMVSLCPHNALSMVFSHISTYQLFTNIPISYFYLISFLSVLLLLFVTLKSFFKFSLLKLNTFLHFIFESYFLFFYKRKILHWISLLENSPSFS